MNINQKSVGLIEKENIPLINMDFDRLELQSELNIILHNAELATFYYWNSAQLTQ